MGTERWRCQVEGRVQGVGFRPWVVVEARRLGLSGQIRNSDQGVVVEAQGPTEALAALLNLLWSVPAPAEPRIIRVKHLDLSEGEVGFEVSPSPEGQAPAPSLPPDLAPCADCIAEMNTPVSRRYRYPFTTCARCGPRATITAALPFDRERTAMAAFPLCDACQAEHDDPQDRRFHAVAMACPSCGPSITFISDNIISSYCNTALQYTISTLKAGKILALKGVGGFHLLCDARSEEAVRRLRSRKDRPDRPLAVLFEDMDQLCAFASPTADETSALQASDAPIVLVLLKPDHLLAPSVTRGLHRVGAMLPCSPLHRLIVADAGGPLVCTSGNRSGQPLARDLKEARAQLSGVADAFLDHDRRVLWPADDSVLRVVQGLPIRHRCGRGQAPLVTPLDQDGPAVLALGAHMKATVTLAWADQAVTSPHIGDLEDAQTRTRLLETAEEMCRFYNVKPDLIAADHHPDYGSTRLAEALCERWRTPLIRVQHHHAHAAAVLAEHGRTEGLALCWDGVGLGTDGLSWGGELLDVTRTGFEHRAGLRPFPAPGGGASRSPARAAISLYQMLQYDSQQQFNIKQILARTAPELDLRLALAALSPSLRPHQSTAMGRLFDAVAFLSGGRGSCTFEAQAAIELEQDAELGLVDDAGSWPMPVRPAPTGPARIDWEPLLIALLQETETGVPRRILAARFHRSLAALAVELAGDAREIALAGGCFQNAVLVRLCEDALTQAGVRPLRAVNHPANDGAISLGQAVVARQRR